jgi:hypothetical protein
MITRYECMSVVVEYLSVLSLYHAVCFLYVYIIFKNNHFLTFLPGECWSLKIIKYFPLFKLFTRVQLFFKVSWFLRVNYHVIDIDDVYRNTSSMRAKNKEEINKYTVSGTRERKPVCAVIKTHYIKQSA